MHGCGNDYVYVNCFNENISDPAAAAIKLSDRRKGIGSDGLVLIMPSKIADFCMRIFNADGSEAQMCGNASRCVGKYLYTRGLTNKKEILLETKAGMRHLQLNTSNGSVDSVSVEMGIADFSCKNIPVLSSKESIINEYIPAFDIGSGSIISPVTRTCLTVGNPHCVYFLPDGCNIDSLVLEKIGPVSENSPEYPERINTEYVKNSENGLIMRVWERGSGETMACGTGACASAAAAVKLGLKKSGTEIPVYMRGGTLKISVNPDFQIYMTGDAEFVFDGETDTNY